LKLGFLKWNKDSTRVVVLSQTYQLLPYNLVEISLDVKLRRKAYLESAALIKQDFFSKGPLPISMLYVMDEFAEKCIASLFNSYPLVRSNFAEQILSSNSQLFFLESCWFGNNGKWQYAMTSRSEDHPARLAIYGAIELAKIKGMKVVFYNKEDPMHFDMYSHIAKKVDMVFTSDQNMVRKYKAMVPGIPVETLRFAAPSNLCNPIGSLPFDERRSVAFAGGYYGKNHDERREQMEARADLSFATTEGDKADIHLAYCPERIIPGKSLEELKHNDRIIGGISNKCSQLAKTF
ncbi:unnamed protein product, partial [marine sediment metagenome]